MSEQQLPTRFCDLISCKKPFVTACDMTIIEIIKPNNSPTIIRFCNYDCLRHYVLEHSVPIVPKRDYDQPCKELLRDGGPRLPFTLDLGLTKYKEKLTRQANN